MIKGVGVDIVNISRIRSTVLKWDDKFLNRFFTDRERSYIYSNNKSYDCISGIFGVKEAVSKVFGTGMRGIELREIEVLHTELGKPYLILMGKAKDLADSLGIDNIDISISHDRDYAISLAIAYGREDRAVDSKLLGLLKKRQADSNKGSYGRLGVIAGSRGMTGANYMASMAALRTGSGLVYSVIPDSLLDIMSIKLIEAVILPLEDEGGHFTAASIKDIEPKLKDFDALVLGPGLGSLGKTKDFVAYIIENYKGPLLLDADALNLMKDDLDILLKHEGGMVITPHPGEFSRLTGLSVKEIQENRVMSSVSFSKKYKVITLLKGHRSLVTDAENLYINETGNPGMATAGSGDLLSGIIASLMAQGHDVFDAACLGTYIHGLAGDLAKEDYGEYGMIARDILEAIPAAIGHISEED